MWLAVLHLRNYFIGVISCPNFQTRVLEVTEAIEIPTQKQASVFNVLSNLYRYYEVEIQN